MKKTIALAIALLGSAAVQAEPSQFYRFVGVDISQTSGLPTPDGTKQHAEFTPEISLGLGISEQLNEDWVLDTKLSLNYASTSLITSPMQQQATVTQADNLGLWATTRLKRDNLFSNLSPFVELSAGVVDVDYQYNGQAKNEWVPGYKLAAGLEFQMSQGATISVSVANSHFNEDQQQF